MQNEASVVIERPIQKVFELANKDVAEWSSIVVEDVPLEGDGTHVGDTFRVVTEEKGRRMEFQGVVTRFDAPVSSAIEMRGKMFDLFVEYEFEDLGGRTRLTQRSRAKGHGVMGLFLTLFGWMMKKSSCDAAQQELGRLKAYVEERC